MSSSQGGDKQRSTTRSPPFLSLPRSRSNTTSSVQSINSIATISIPFGADAKQLGGFNAVAGSSRDPRDYSEKRGNSSDRSRRPSLLSMKGFSSSASPGGISKDNARGTASRSYSTPLSLKSTSQGPWAESSKPGRSSSTSPLARSSNTSREHDLFEEEIDGLPLGSSSAAMTLSPGGQHRSPSEEALLYHLECDAKREGQEELTLRTFSERDRGVTSDIHLQKEDRREETSPIEVMVRRQPGPLIDQDAGEELSKSLGRRSMDTFRTARATPGLDMEKDKPSVLEAGVSVDEDTVAEPMAVGEGEDTVAQPGSSMAIKTEVDGSSETPAAGMIWRLGSWVYDSLPSIRGAPGSEAVVTPAMDTQSQVARETTARDAGVDSGAASAREEIPGARQEVTEVPAMILSSGDISVPEDLSSAGQGSGWMGSMYFWRGAKKETDLVSSTKPDVNSHVDGTVGGAAVDSAESNESLSAGSGVPSVDPIADVSLNEHVAERSTDSVGVKEAKLGTIAVEEPTGGKSLALRFKSSLVRDPVIDALSRPVTVAKESTSQDTTASRSSGTAIVPADETPNNNPGTASSGLSNSQDTSRTPESAPTPGGWWFGRRTSGLSTASKSPLLASGSRMTDTLEGESLATSAVPTPSQSLAQPENAMNSHLPKPAPTRMDRRASVVVRKNQVLPSWNSTFHRAPRSVSSMGATKREGDGLPRLEHDNKSCWKGIRRVVVIGVHGWFPNTHIQKVVGAPRTSGYFCSMMGQAVLAAFEDAHGIGENQLDKLTYMPLDGEGSIAERVDKLYGVCTGRPDWVIDLGQADAIFVAAHSQGCIVAAHVMARLIQEGYIATAQGPLRPQGSDPGGVLDSVGRIGRSDANKYPRIALLSMCGVHLGPFWNSATSTVMTPYLWFEHPSARELFDFQETTSLVSEQYQESLSLILDCGVKVILLASLDDQMVPIYSASFSAARHPGILRTLYVDSSITPAHDFILNLIVLGLMMLNAGLDDQGLISHLSEATAGAWRGVGHSNAYEDPGGYDLAVNYLLKTSSPMGESLVVEPFSARDAKNDFELPWILRGVMDDPHAVELFRAEIKALKDTILTWQPDTRALREIKKRLEPMAGRAAIRLYQQGARLRSSPSSASIHSSEGNIGNKPAAPENATTESAALGTAGQ